jgi:hypothetical protein
MARKQKWIQQALRKQKKGSLSRQLGIPEEKNIPVTLLNKIKAADIGDTVKNPCETGKSRVKVTRLLKKRAVLASTLNGPKK